MKFEYGINDPRTDYLDLMHLALSAASDNDIFIECGVYMGESLSKLIDLSKQYRKKISINAIDLFGFGDLLLNKNQILDIPKDNTVIEWSKNDDGDFLFPTFIKNLRDGNRLKDVNSIIISDINSAATNFGDKSVFFCFIDAGHSYNDVFTNLCSFYPKMKYGGLLCGHDYVSGPQIKQAVDDFGYKYKLKLRFFGPNFFFFID